MNAVRWVVLMTIAGFVGYWIGGSVIREARERTQERSDWVNDCVSKGYKPADCVAMLEYNVRP